MVLERFQKELDQPRKRVLSGERDTDQPKRMRIVEQLDEEAQRKLEVIQSLLEPCDRTTYGQKLREATLKLGCSVRTVQRLVMLPVPELCLVRVIGEGALESVGSRGDQWKIYTTT